MKLTAILICCLCYLGMSAQTEKLLLELGATGEKLNASRYSVADKYNANYTVNDLGHGFVLSFDRTYAFFDNEMELQWKATLPKYVKQGPTPIVLGDVEKTYVIDFSPSFLAFNSMEIKEINNQSGKVETYELIWKGNENYFADYNLYNGVVSILFVSPSSSKHVYRLMTLENRKLTETTLDLPHDASDMQLSLVPTYQGDFKSGEVLNLVSQYYVKDKDSKRHIIVYKTLDLSPKGKIISATKRKEFEVDDLEYNLWFSKVPLQLLDVNGQRYFVGQMHQKGAPKGWIFGTISPSGEFKIITKHLVQSGGSSEPVFRYISSSKTFVVQTFNFVGTKSAKLYRSFFDVYGQVVCDDNFDVDPNLYYNFSISTYKNRVSTNSCAKLPSTLSYFNIVDEYSQKNNALPICFNALPRGNDHIFIIVDPNTGKVMGRKVN